MSKLILALSTFKYDRETKKPVAALEYHYPGSETGTIWGAQTNDAPVKYLLKYAKESTECSPVDTIIALLTEEAEEDGWEQFKEMVQTECGEKCPQFVGIKYTRETEAKAFDNLLSNIELDDEILLDTTGAFRDLANLVALTARLAEFRGNKLVKAVYSDFTVPGRVKVIRDVTNSQFGMLNVISGMDECVSYGQTKKLNDPWKEVAGDLLEKMQAITDAVTLCKTHQLDDLYKELNTALAANLQNDTITMDLVLLEQMKTVFRKKFGLKEDSEGEIDDIAVIRWCLDNGMLQQAITLYVERIPKWIMEKKKILTVCDAFRDAVKDKEGIKPTTKSYKDVCAIILTEYFLRLFLTFKRESNQRVVLKEWDGGNYYERLQKNMPDLREGFAIYENRSIDCMEKWVDVTGTPFQHGKVSVKQLKILIRDYWYIKEQRNRYNHALSEPSKKAANIIKKYFENYGYTWGDTVTVESLTDTIRNALEHLESCAEEAKKECQTTLNT